MNNVSKLIEEKIKSLSTSYASEETIKKEFANFDDTISIKELYEKYAHFFGQSTLAKHLKQKTTSDFSYWGYVVEEETYGAIADIYLAIINLESDNNLVTGAKYENVKNQADHYSSKYKKIVDKIKEEKKGLLKYKPSGYKSKIELLESLLED